MSYDISDLNIRTTDDVIPTTHIVKSKPTDIIQDYIIARLPNRFHPLSAAAHHHFNKPGKFIRARMALAAAESFGVDREIALPWAVAVELLHNASLVHDDICDGDKVRRGQPSVWARFGRDTSLALGDWLIALSFELAAEASILGNTPQLVSVLSRHMLATTSGQAMEFEPAPYPNWKRYLAISTGKTAPLFIAPVEGAALLAARNDVIEPLTRFFTAAGACYQISNDILNVIGSDGAKNPRSDLRRRAPNAVIVKFRASLEGHDAKAFDEWLSVDDTTKAEYWQDRLSTSPAMQMTVDVMMKMLSNADISSQEMPSDCVSVITPIQTQLREVCRQVAADCSCG